MKGETTMDPEDRMLTNIEDYPQEDRDADRRARDEAQKEHESLCL